jgi:hypothetical protein
MAISILRKFSACASSCDWNSILSSFDSPSTRSATGLPKRSAISTLAHRRVLHHVVQQRRNHPLHIHLPFGDRTGYRQGVSNVGFSRQAQLPTMRSLAEQIRLPYDLNFFRRKIAQSVDENLISGIVLWMRRQRGVVSHRQFTGQAGCGNRIPDHTLPNRCRESQA